MSEIQRFDIPSKPTRIEMFRAFRTYLERSFAAKGQKLAPAWYADSPEEKPGLYEDQPEVLAALKKKNDEDRTIS
jgi:hypothetical protein